VKKIINDIPENYLYDLLLVKRDSKQSQWLFESVSTGGSRRKKTIFRNTLKIYSALLCIFIASGFSEAQQSWHDLQGGVYGSSGGVNDLTVYYNKLIVLGAFDSAGGNYCGGIASWNGINWESFGKVFLRGASTVSVYKNELYVGGAARALTIDSISPSFESFSIVRWNGMQWQNAGSKNSDYGEIFALRVYNI